MDSILLKKTAFFILLMNSMIAFSQEKPRILTLSENSIINRSDCDPVSNLAASIEDTTTVHISWTETNASSYIVVRDGDTINTQTITFFVDENVPFGTHNYCILAVYDECISDPECIFITVAPENCIPPENFTITVDDENYETPTFILTWDAVSYVKSYNVYMNNILIEVGITETMYPISGCTANVEYCFNVTTLCEYSESDFSSTVCATIIDEECEPPALFIAAFSFADMLINMAWETTLNAISYNLYRDDIFLVNVMTNSYADADIEFGDTYCYTVVSVCETGESSPTIPECVDVTNISEYENLFKMYPNPTQGTFFIESDATIQKIQIFNLIGQNVYNNSNCDKNISISASIWESGIYLVQVTTDFATVTKKIMIQ